jgi:hypothetical protein
MLNNFLITYNPKHLFGFFKVSIQRHHLSY